VREKRALISSLGTFSPPKKRDSWISEEMGHLSSSSLLPISAADKKKNWTCLHIDHLFCRDSQKMSLSKTSVFL